MAKGGLRCIEGRLFRHDPQHDDPDLETDVGQCCDCHGKGCDAMTKSGWTNIYRASDVHVEERRAGFIYPTREEAIEWAEKRAEYTLVRPVATIEITWSEPPNAVEAT